MSRADEVEQFGQCDDVRGSEFLGHPTTLSTDAGKTMDGSDAFERLVSLLDYPMFVVTTRADDDTAGCLVGFATQVSINPQRFLVGLSKRNHTFGVARRSEHLAVHLLNRTQCGLALLFGGETGDCVDKFTRCTWHPGPHGLPVLDDAAGWFVGAVLNRFDLGDHVGFLLEPVAGNAPAEFETLVRFSDVRDLEPGHEPE
jgi:flavin reductase (DIM6/NTAB) family NADH-FMN oxidoreductase RutF